MRLNNLTDNDIRVAALKFAFMRVSDKNFILKNLDMIGFDFDQVFIDANLTGKLPDLVDVVMSHKEDRYG